MERWSQMLSVIVGIKKCGKFDIFSVLGEWEVIV